MAHAQSITLTNEEVLYLQSLTRQRTIQAQVVDRAKMLLYKAQGASNSDIAERLDVNINTVKLCLSKFREGGVQRALFDDKRKGRPVEITDDAIAWIISIACQRPADLGYAQELWTLKKSSSVHPKSRRRGWIFKAYNYHKTNGTEDTEPIRN